MNGFGGRFGRGGLMFAMLATASGVCAAAAEPERGSNGGLAEAKRDYDAIKVPTQPLQQAPSIDLPEPPLLELKSESPSSGTTSVRGRKLTEQERLRELEREKEQSRHWLIEAVARQEKPAAAADTEAKPNGGAPNAGELARAARLMALLDAIAAPKSAEPPRHDSAAAPESDSRPAVINPLDRYMASWMTPGDFKLLGANRGDAGSADPSPNELLATGPSAAQPSGGAARALADALAADPRGRPAQENPYLRDFAGMPPMPSRLLEATPPGSAVPPPNLMPTRRDPPPPAPVVAPSFVEQVKAQNDARYFKQLKRF